MLARAPKAGLVILHVRHMLRRLTRTSLRLDLFGKALTHVDHGRSSGSSHHVLLGWRCFIWLLDISSAMWVRLSRSIARLGIAPFLCGPILTTCQVVHQLELELLQLRLVQGQPHRSRGR